MAQTIQGGKMPTRDTRRRRTPCKPLSVVDHAISVWKMRTQSSPKTSSGCASKDCGICVSDLQQSDPLQTVIELTGGPGPTGQLEVKGGHTDTAANPRHLSGHKHMAEPIADF